MSREGEVVVDQVWKRFRVDRGRQLLRDHAKRAHGKIRGTAGDNPWRWVLRDISFSVEPGEAVGVVGANGAGKSTLLKIVNGLMFPHSGRVQTHGKVGAIIEVMSGIHSELTGRENINIYGNLLGLSRKQVAARFDEIVAFAEIEDAIDRQVKFYSSGMKVRLGFSVAAFLEPSILIVDEVLAVGDQSFQQKCLDRMRQVIQGGTTLLLVSHDLASVGATANRAIWLRDGLMMADGPVDDVLGGYRRAIERRAEESADVQGLVRVVDVQSQSLDGRPVATSQDCRVRLELESDHERSVRLFLGVSEGAATPIFVVRHVTTIPEGRTTIEIELDHLPLPPRSYFLWFSAYDRDDKAELTAWQPIGPFIVSGNMRLPPVPRAIVRLSPVFVAARWSKVS
ncbi:MAG TPA: ABC transporter ATP-binding protein [Acidimicrobiia bacterium]|nr:ABC transporter ATP-binding protein [Acidimicrobiia bacterium]